MHDPKVPRLDVSRLTRYFSGKAVVSDLSLRIGPGEITCLLGESGCGKSTVLRMISGVDTPDSGTIRMDGEVLFSNSVDVAPERRKIGLMFQDFALFPHMSVSDNVAFGLAGGVRKNKPRVEELLRKVGMSHHAHAYPHELSGGEQQRIALARALAPRPQLMLMDEPFSGLDDRLRDDVRDETLEVLKSEGAAVLLVTHDPSEAMRMADQIAMMRGGKIVQTGAPSELYNAPHDRATAGFFSDINVISGRVSCGVVETVLGGFSAPGLDEGTFADVVFRPQHVHLDFGGAVASPVPSVERGVAASARVHRARFVGAHSLLELVMQDGTRMSVAMRDTFLPAAGTEFWVSLRRKHGLVFAAQ